MLVQRGHPIYQLSIFHQQPLLAHRWCLCHRYQSLPRPVQSRTRRGPNGPCSDDRSTWTFYTFSGWQGIGEDLQSVVQNPGFANPAYPADDYSLSKGSPGIGFVVFDPNQAGRTNPVIKPPAVAATFPTKTFNPATDY
jgi:hypothetical protein